MDFRETPEQQRFRAEVRTWLEKNVPPGWGGPGRHGPEDPAEQFAFAKAWQRKLCDGGWAGLAWPVEYGGRGASIIEQMIWSEEYARAWAPDLISISVGITLTGPVLMTRGQRWQKERFLPRILSGEEVWCQGFSEPVAGSDLANLQTRADRDGDHYVVNGHKIWTSFAHCADFCELLVRTDPNASKHGGISWLIMPMDAEGIEIRPLPTLMGEGEFSEVFLENVRIPVENRVGAENDGWRVTNVTLRFERGTAFASEMYQLQETLAGMVDLAKHVTRHDAAAWEDRSLRREIGHFAAQLDALWAMVKLSVSETAKTGMPGLGASAIKLFYSTTYQQMSELGLRLLGRAALSCDDLDDLPCERSTYRALQSLSLTIAAGTSQIQRNIIGERILGLPRDPKPVAAQGAR
jgi:alkylation response protein AidB-like acyl-CoA dehydrogenase